jgi:hypothetical protein
MFVVLIDEINVSDGFLLAVKAEDPSGIGQKLTGTRMLNYCGFTARQIAHGAIAKPGSLEL